MNTQEILNKCSEIEADTGDALHLLRAFGVWFDKSFKAYDLDRRFDPNAAADLWAECPDFAAVLDAAVCALLKADRALDKLSEEGVEE
jgi:hypothetical protein